MLKQYNYIELMLEKQNSSFWFFEPKLKYFANDIMKMMEIIDAIEIDSSLNRAFQACGTLNIPFNRNFKKIYRFDGENIVVDWKISSLACYLIIINCSPCHEIVAKAQLYFALNREMYSKPI